MNVTYVVTRYKKGTTMRPIKITTAQSFRWQKPVTVGTHVSSEAERARLGMSPGPR